MDKYDKTSESALWQSFKSGDKTAFKAIYYEYYMLLYRYGVKTSADTELAEDCLQDLFLKLWKNRENLGEVSSVKSYLYRAYIRTLFDAMKKFRKEHQFGDLSTETSESSIEETIIEGQTHTESNLHLHRALQHLSRRQRQVVLLHYFEGLSYKQIAEVLPIKYQAIRNCIHEAIKVLRKNIASRSG
ncbi:RNA polymerase sigma factor [Pedobacter caeni]|uniref:RNA polymerase sigma factor, sigma-70 family n=1 Tax=Pedobacter caeni TaxID=288992 RepID=A0A1M5GD35_9SPHI|nr:sigma-70 family RNA polymerase sigma factor [Pedobacter caeni]SHG01643.1 RNA polymerase sigma factor, sigma-70 family [Pedobacter caeni]